MSKIKEKLQSDIEKIKRFRPIDDSFFQKLAEDPEVMEEILRVILDDKKLEVVEVTPQNNIKNLQGRSVVLDALCRRGDGRICNIEVENSNNKNHLKRVRYNASCITANIVEPGEEFENIPNIDMVYISAFDVFKLGKVIYHIEPTILETDNIVDNGLHEVYVNTAVKDDSEVSELMQCFLQTEVDNDKFPKLSNRVKYFKNSEEGIGDMCSIVDEWKAEARAEGLAEGRAEGRAEGIREGMKDAIGRMLTKLSLEDIVDLGYDREYVLEIVNSR